MSRYNFDGEGIEVPPTPGMVQSTSRSSTYSAGLDRCKKNECYALLKHPITLSIAFAHYNKKWDSEVPEDYNGIVIEPRDRKHACIYSYENSKPVTDHSGNKYYQFYYSSLNDESELDKKIKDFLKNEGTKLQNLIFYESKLATPEIIDFFITQLKNANFIFSSMKIKIPIQLSEDEQSKHSPDARKIFPNLVQEGSKNKGGSQFSISLYIVMLIAERLYTKFLTEDKDYKNITDFSPYARVTQNLHIYFKFDRNCGTVDKNGSQYCKFQGYFHFFKARKVGIAYHAYPESQSNYVKSQRFRYDYGCISDYDAIMKIGAESNSSSSSSSSSSK